MFSKCSYLLNHRPAFFSYSISSGNSLVDARGPDVVEQNFSMNGIRRQKSQRVAKCGYCSQKTVLYLVKHLCTSPGGCTRNMFFFFFTHSILVKPSTILLNWTAIYLRACQPSLTASKVFCTTLSLSFRVELKSC